MICWPLLEYSFFLLGCMPLVERLAPRGILLDHYDDAFPPMSATVDTAGFVTAAEKRLGIPCRALKKYETLTL